MDKIKVAVSVGNSGYKKRPKCFAVDLDPEQIDFMEELKEVARSVQSEGKISFGCSSPGDEESILIDFKDSDVLTPIFDKLRGHDLYARSYPDILDSQNPFDDISDLENPIDTPILMEDLEKMVSDYEPYFP